MANRKSAKHKIDITSVFPIFIFGGARSGKSNFALQLVEANFLHPVYLATAQAQDDEMRKRITLHQKARSHKWHTIEEHLDLIQAIKSIPKQTDAVLIDCITLWITNSLLQEGEKAFLNRLHKFTSFIKGCEIPIIIVSNEVGMGIVPENKLARDFRDLAGLCNQKLAQACSTVILTMAGCALPLKYKGESMLKKIFGESKALFST